MYYNKLTVEDFNKCINEIFGKPKSNKKNFTLVVGEKTANILDVIYKRELGIISNRECTVRCLAIKNNAYIYPGWDYWSLPLVDTYFYSNSKTNAIYEEDDEENIIYIGRLGFENKN